MNESMNFGNLSFNTVSNDSTNSTVAENNISATNNVAIDNNENNQEIAKPQISDSGLSFSTSTVVKKDNYEKEADNFSSIEFGPLQKYLDDDDITDISYSNGGQLWLKSLSKGVYRADQQDVNNALIEKIAFQCSNVMGKTFNMAHPFLDSESAELRMNFVHDSIARNGIAVVFRKTPAKIRLEKNKLLNERYVTLSIHDFLINCVRGHCNIIVCGETGSGKTELVKYLASHTAENEKLITIEDTLELHLDRIFPTRDIVAMKTNNIASYSDVLVTCMRQNPKWILLSEVRSAEAVTAVRNSISSGHNILSTIHADKSESIPHRMYSLLESNIDVEQFLKTIYRYVQLGIFVRGRFDPSQKRFVREIAGVTEFFVTDDNEAQFNNIYRKTVSGEETYNEPSKYLKMYLEGQGVDINNLFGENKASLEQAQGVNVNQEIQQNSTVDNNINMETTQNQIDNNQYNQNLDTKAMQNQEPVNPYEQNMNMAPMQNQVPLNPYEQNVNMAPMQTQVPINPYEQNMNMAPMQTQVPINPYEQNMNMAPMQNQMPVNPYNQNMNMAPIENQINSNPYIQNMNQPIGF